MHDVIEAMALLLQMIGRILAFALPGGVVVALLGYWCWRKAEL